MSVERMTLDQKDEEIAAEIAGQFVKIDPTMKMDVTKIEAEKFTVAFSIIMRFVMGLPPK